MYTDYLWMTTLIEWQKQINALRNILNRLKEDLVFRKKKEN